LLGQITLCRQPAADGKFARQHARAQLLGNLAVQALGFDGYQWHDVLCYFVLD
jgi:hypothetical protein